MKAIRMETGHTALRRTLMGLCLAAAAAASPAQAERVIRLIVPYGPGATLDTVARNFNADLGKALGATVIVENRAGAGGTMGTTFVARSTDHNTLLFTAASHNLAPSLYRSPGYDPIKDFSGVAYVGNAGFVIAVPGTLGVDSLQDYIKAIKAKPGELNYSSAGNGGATHLAMASFLANIGGKMQHIPMKATGDAINEVLAGRTQGTAAAVPAIIGFKSEARVRMLAYTGAKRSPLLPELPTAAEAGAPGYKYDTWFGILAPRNMPQNEIDKIHAAMDKVLADTTVQARLTRLGIDSEQMSAEAFNTLLRKDFEAAGPLVKASGANIE
ncbi:tripartite tricarboxylate transporter substrate-binding protein [Pigmentiphaga sp. YJ18]|uniref:tripartite tricarboxylate transporter substrate-binding protein n=1 Tax=Pigmentiphaga sp. YJ18 TaxID=3134907 RepID=UPI00311272EC